jgi:hypothetical protein
MLGCALGCVIVLLALLSAPSPASFTDHKGTWTGGAGATGPSGSEQSGAGTTRSSHSNQHAFGSDGIVPDANTTDPDPDFGDGFEDAWNNSSGVNFGSPGYGGHQDPGNSDSNFSDGRGFGGGFGGGFGSGYFSQDSEPGKQDKGDGTDGSGETPPSLASVLQPEPGTNTDQPPHTDEDTPVDGPHDDTPRLLRFDDPSIDKPDASDPAWDGTPNMRDPVQVPEPPSWMIVLALLGLAFSRCLPIRIQHSLKALF